MPKPLTVEKLKQMRTEGEEAWGDIHTSSRQMMAFSHGAKNAQWDPEVLSGRVSAKRPSQQYNVCSGFVRPTVNALKEAPCEIAIHPISGATKADAQAMAGLIRHIQYESNASRAYLHAVDCAMRGGIGAWRIIPKMVRGKIKLIIDWVKDPTRITIDPSAQAMDYSDAKWVSIETQIGEDDYKDMSPDGAATANACQVTIWETWHEVTRREPVLDDYGAQIYEGGKPVSEDRVHVEHYLDDGLSILSHQTDYLGTMIPIVLITGPRVSINDRDQIFSVTHEIAPMQREINWLKSEAVAQISSYPKAQFMSSDKAIEGREDSWEDSATSPDAVLLFKDGHTPPEAIAPPPPPNGYMALAAENIEMARQVTGVYPDPTLQAKADAPSGKAIKAQRMGSGVANFHYVDAMNYGMKRTGEMLAELCAEYLNDDDIRVALGADGGISMVSLGPNNVPDAVNIDLKKARFGITISTGPSYASQREEAMERVSEFFQGDPEGKVILSDWFLRQSGIPGIESVADRMVARLPPAIREVVEGQESSDPAEQVANLRLKLQTMEQQSQLRDKMLDQLTKALEHEKSLVDQMEADKSGERETTLQVTQANNEAKLQLEQMRGESAEDATRQKALLELQLAQMHLDHDAVESHRDRLSQDSRAYFDRFLTPANPKA